MTHYGDLIASYWVFSIREHLILHYVQFIPKVLNLAIEIAYVAFFSIMYICNGVILCVDLRSCQPTGTILRSTEEAVRGGYYGPGPQLQTEREA